METLKIGIVEDDLLIAESIAVALQQIGYRHTEPVRSYAEALEMIKTENPDLILIDIVLLPGQPDGIELAETVNSKFSKPFIFLTGNSDAATVNRAKKVSPAAYLVKPFTQNELFASIEIACSNYYKGAQSEPAAADVVSYLKDILLIKENNVFYKIEIADILYVESDNVYLSVFTTNRKFVVRAKMDEFIALSGHAVFARVHRSYAVNLKHLSTIGEVSVKLGNKEVPMQKAYKQQLVQSIGLLK